MRAVHVVGGGPAGVMVAFAAMREGAPVRIFEKSAFPRHKVCGEFLSPAILPRLLLEHAASAGAQVVREHWSAISALMSNSCIACVANPAFLLPFFLG
jgi:flavin-dependent dehydrogenase